MKPNPAAGRHGTAALAALALAWLAATAWVRPLMLPDEGRYVGVAWEMLRSGDWLTPTLNGLPFFHKPPLFYWITAASMAVFGRGEWAARAAPLLGAWLGAMSLYVFMRRWCAGPAARMALLVLLVQPLFFVGAQFANLDMLVAGCITATIVLLAHAALCQHAGRSNRRALAAAYAMAALGVLAKGLIGLVLPALVVLAWLVTMRWWRVLGALLWWPGLLIFMILTAPWFVAMQRQFPDFLNYFFVVQHFQRFAKGGFNNVQPAWFYPAVLLLAAVPWLPWLATRLRPARPPGEPTLGRPVQALMMLWAALVVLFFSLPQSKLVGYVLPALPPLAALLAGLFVAPGLATPRGRRLWWAGACTCGTLSLAAVAGLALYPLPSSRGEAAALRAGAPQDPVYLLQRYGYDLPFYAHLAGPVKVVDDWSAPDVLQHDNWRKELAEAGRFAPARAAAVLLTPAQLPAALCRAPVNWLVGPAAAPANDTLLAHARLVTSRRGTGLWLIDTTRPDLAGALGCAERPNGGPADR
ncbi:MAG TPA: glycosyltransferase family 39 protein [Burkholderiaceae bacterium]|nr:glycosyltransferase family 39 protein [Burkholderiaceae bacterium]